MSSHTHTKPGRLAPWKIRADSHTTTVRVPLPGPGCASLPLRLREAGIIKSTPQKIIAENTDWRFLNELKRELKA